MTWENNKSNHSQTPKVRKEGKSKNKLFSCSSSQILQQEIPCFL